MLIILIISFQSRASSIYIDQSLKFSFPFRIGTWSMVRLESKLSAWLGRVAGDKADAIIVA